MTVRQRTNRATRANLRELAYKSIQDLIATRRLKPGDYINERSLSKELGIGRTPTHQALEQLTHDKLVQFIPGRGSIVRAIGPREVLEITEVRSPNEELCARLAAQYATKNDVDELTDILIHSQHWAAMRNVERLLLLDRSLHTCLARISRNLLLQDILSNLHARSLGYWFVVPGTPMRLGQIASEHAKIVGTIKRGDADAAAQAMRLHIESFRSAIEGAFTADDATPPAVAAAPSKERAKTSTGSGPRSREKPQYASASPPPTHRNRGAQSRRSKPHADPGKRRDDRF